MEGGELSAGERVTFSQFFGIRRNPNSRRAVSTTTCPLTKMTKAVSIGAMLCALYALRWFNPWKPPAEYAATTIIKKK